SSPHRLIISAQQNWRRTERCVPLPRGERDRGRGLGRFRLSSALQLPDIWYNVASMTTHEQNDFLTRTGPGTPMGDLMRRYWIPALLSSEIPEPDCPPVRVKLLGERLIAFRDTAGRVGVMDEFCAHRGVSLWFGRNEEGGLRCPYHGWKYDTSGLCIEVPSEPAESGFCNKIKLTAYPCVELGDAIWIYMGPAALKPPAPNFEWATVPAASRFVSKRTQECNWL